MPICKPAEIKGKLARGQPVLGLDLGTKTIGVAISDVGLMIASPLLTLKRKKFSQDYAELNKIIQDRDVGALVIGLPVEMSGAEGPRAQSARAFAAEVLKRRDLPVAFWDERMSTAAVQRMLTDEADLSRKRRAELVDKAAAAYILQGLLDSIVAPTV
ncbi:MAG: Holliday junction resolvase RuvX [Rhodospirillaceae bacterium]|nr:Holliday junction resolvase RuvX [Rhodospirillaceae bacterium]